MTSRRRDARTIVMTMQRLINISRSGLASAMIFAAVSLTSVSAIAEENSNQPSRNWELWVGGGMAWSPEYLGSDESPSGGTPFAFGYYDKERYRLFLVGDEAGVSVKFTEDSPLSLSLSAKMGEFTRDHDDDDLLLDTPDLSNNFQLLGGLEADLSFATLSTTLRYAPISSEYDGSVYADEDYSGLMVDVDIDRQLMKIPFIFMFNAGATWMNDEGMEANFSVLHPTTQLEAYEASGGMYDLHASAKMVLMLHEHFGTLYIADVQKLIGDAADSPLTQEELQKAFYILAFYRF